MAYSNQAFVEAAVLLKSYLHNTPKLEGVVVVHLSYDQAERKFTAKSVEKTMTFKISNGNRIVEFVIF